MIAIVSAAANHRLLDPEKLRKQIGAPGETATEIADLTDLASEVISDHLGLPRPLSLARQTYEEKLPGDGSPWLPLSVAPVEAVVEVSIDAAAVTDYELEDPLEAILYREAGWPWRPHYTGGAEPIPIVGTEERNVTVEWKAGFWLPTDTGSQPAGSFSLPAKIVRACFETVKAWWADQKRDHRIRYRRGGGGEIGFASQSEPGDLPPIALALLRDYRRKYRRAA